MRTLLGALAILALLPTAARADGGGLDLASPRAPTGVAPATTEAPAHEAAHEAASDEHHEEGPRDTPMLDLSAVTLVPLSVGGAMHLDLLAGIFVRVSGSVVIPAYVDAINDVGQSYGAWDATVAASLRELLVDSLVIEAAVGVRPLGGPFELSVAYFMLWSEGPAPAGMGLGERTMSVSIYAVHPELGIRIPMAGWIVMRVQLGWVHTVGVATTLGRSPTDDPTADALRTAAESSLADTVRSYGMGPSLAASVGIHFE